MYNTQVALCCVGIDLDINYYCNFGMMTPQGVPRGAPHLNSTEQCYMVLILSVTCNIKGVKMCSM